MKAKKEFKTPADMPLICLLAAGEDGDAKMALVTENVMSLCRYIDENGYSFGEGSDGPLQFFKEHKHSAKAGADLIKNLLCIIYAEELVKEKGTAILKDQRDPARN